nr:immunoglobulin light chain junction region [Macaca mulatta]
DYYCQSAGGNYDPLF